MASKTLFEIRGKVVEKKTRKPLPNLTVEAFDKDLLFDDLLGSATTDERGGFKIRYDNKAFDELAFDKKPDVFIRITNARGDEIYTTCHQVRFEANRVEEFLVEIPQTARFLPAHTAPGTRKHAQ